MTVFNTAISEPLVIPSLILRLLGFIAMCRTRVWLGSSFFPKMGLLDSPDVEKLG